MGRFLHQSWMDIISLSTSFCQPGLSEQWIRCLSCREQPKRWISGEAGPIIWANSFMKPKERDWRQLQTRYYGTLWNLVDYGNLWNKSFGQFQTFNAFPDRTNLERELFQRWPALSRGIFHGPFQPDSWNSPWRLAIKSGRLTSISGRHWDDLGWMFED